MINLKSLNIPDVVIIVQQGDILVTSPKEDVMNDVKNLPCPIKIMSNGPNTEIISGDAVDCLVLAETLASTWEEQDYKVQRVYTPNNVYNRKLIKSFNLCETDEKDCNIV